jgi:hypothetical protein
VLQLAAEFAAQLIKQRIRDWCGSQIADSGPIEVSGSRCHPEVLDAASQTQFRDTPAVLYEPQAVLAYPAGRRSPRVQWKVRPAGKDPQPGAGDA